MKECSTETYMAIGSANKDARLIRTSDILTHSFILRFILNPINASDNSPYFIK